MVPDCHCALFEKIIAWLYLTSICAPALLGYLRVCALFDKKSGVVILFACLEVAVLAGCITGLTPVIEGVTLGPTNHCLHGRPASYAVLSAAIPLLNDTLTFLALTTHLMHQSECRTKLTVFTCGAGLQPLAKMLLRHAQFYFMWATLVSFVFPQWFSSIGSQLWQAFQQSSYILDWLPFRTLQYSCSSTSCCAIQSGVGTSGPWDKLKNLTGTSTSGVLVHQPDSQLGGALQWTVVKKLQYRRISTVRPPTFNLTWMQPCAHTAVTLFNPRLPGRFLEYISVQINPFGFGQHIANLSCSLSFL